MLPQKGINTMAKIKCLQCGEILHSKHRHDFVQCKCSNEAFVDGGYDYCRYGAMKMHLVEILPDDVEDKKDEKTK